MQGTDADRRRGLILVVDDEPSNRSLLRAHLASEYDLVEAEDGVQALEAFERRRPDLVLLDLMMPRLDGLATCRVLKERTAPQFLPVILLTALNEASDRHAAFEAGADDFVSKPFDRRELTLRVRAFLRLKTQEETIRSQVAAIDALRARQADLFHLLLHDLRNPLAGAIGFLELLCLPGAAPNPTFAQNALDGARRVRALLEDVLTVRSLEEGELSLHKQRVVLAAVVHEAEASMRGFARLGGVTLVVPPEGSGPTLEVDPTLIRRALENVLANAIRYSPPGARVEVEIHASATTVHLEVLDRGPGVPDAMKRTIFDKFKSVEGAKGLPTRGFGLGLHLVELVLNAHEGAVLVRDRPGGGSVFDLQLPLEPASS